MMTKSLISTALIAIATLSITLSGCKPGEAPVDPNKKIWNEIDKKKKEGKDDGGSTIAPLVEPTDLIIEEIFYSGSLIKIPDKLKEGKYKFNSRHGEKFEALEQFIKINNPTKETQYLDGLLLVMGDLSANRKLILSTDPTPMQKNVAASCINQFPGTAGETKNYPIEAGQSVTIAYMPFNFSLDSLNPHSLDLSKAEYYLVQDEYMEDQLWYDLGKTLYDDFLSLEKKPVLVTPVAYARWYDVWKDRWSEPELINRLFDMQLGNMFVGLARPKDGKTAKDLMDENNLWKYTFSGQEGNGYHKGNNMGRQPYLVAILVPNDWIVDGVVLCPVGEKVWDIVDKSIDAGFNAVQKTSSDIPESFCGKALRRKHNGKFFQDRNNSSLDFDVVTLTEIKDVK